MAFTKEQVIAQAITIVGGPPINAIVDGEEFSEAASLGYDLLYDSLLSSHRWRLATKIVPLSKSVVNPIIDLWKFSYILPSDYLTLDRLHPNVQHQIFGDKLFTNKDNVDSDLIIEYRFSTPVEKLPTYYIRFLVYSLAHHLALGVAQKFQYVAELERMMDSARAAALFNDSQSSGNVEIQNNPFVFTNTFNNRIR